MFKRALMLPHALWDSVEKDQTTQLVQQAFEAGFRGIDTVRNPWFIYLIMNCLYYFQSKNLWTD